MKRAKVIYPMPESGDLVLSYSAIDLFRKCRKAYELGYELGIDTGSSDAAQKGTDFHKYAEIAAKHKIDGTLSAEDREYLHSDNPMGEVWKAYKAHRPLPDAIIFAERPIYLKIFGHVWLRVTLDLVYHGDFAITGRDYKTFEKAPTLDVDLDFQGRLYVAALMRYFKTDSIEFEYEYVRRVTPGTKNSKGVWTENECYITEPVVIGREEADRVWDDMIETVKDIMRARRGQSTFYRSGKRKEFGSPCMSCWYTDLCKADNQYGFLDDETIALLSSGKRDPVVLPPKNER
jgi:hypothetical protein